MNQLSWWHWSGYCLTLPYPDECTFYNTKKTIQVAHCLGKSLSTTRQKTGAYLEQVWLQLGSIHNSNLVFTISIEDIRYWIVWHKFTLHRFPKFFSCLWSFLTFSDLLASFEISKPTLLEIRNSFTNMQTQTRVEIIPIFNRLAESTVWTCLIDREILKFLFP